MKSTHTSSPGCVKTPNKKLKVSNLTSVRVPFKMQCDGLKPKLYKKKCLSVKMCGQFFITIFIEAVNIQSLLCATPTELLSNQLPIRPQVKYCNQNISFQNTVYANSQYCVIHAAHKKCMKTFAHFGQNVISS